MTSPRLRYRTIEFGDTDIHVRTLRDRQQFSDEGGVAEKLGISSAAWPIFGVIWTAGELLAHLMSEHEIEGLRILEVGCGIGLASLVLNQRRADITATDHHPEAHDFLRENVRLNGGQEIPFVRTGWAEGECGLGAFDLIIGSDLLYEREQVESLSAFINHHARKNCEVVLVDPGRGHHACFSRKMVAMGYSHSQSQPENISFLSQPFRGQILRYRRQPASSQATPLGSG